MNDWKTVLERDGLAFRSGSDGLVSCVLSRCEAQRYQLALNNDEHFEPMDEVELVVSLQLRGIDPETGWF